MRRFAVVSVVVSFLMVFAAPSARAVNSVLNFKASISPAKAGTKSKPASVGVNLRPYYDTLAPDADAPFAWKTVVLSLPKEFVFNGKYFPSCPAAKVRTAAGRASCKSAEIGKVNAKGFALGLVEPLQVKLYNRPGGTGVVFYLQGDTPVIIDHVVEGILKKTSGAFGWTMTFSIPDDLQQPAPGAVATPLDFDTHITARTIKKGKKKIPFVGLTGCPTGTLNFGFDVSLTDGTQHNLRPTASCSK